jgi:hypothetical protein
MDSLLSFPVGLFHPYNVPVYPGALRVADDSYRIVESRPQQRLPPRHRCSRLLLQLVRDFVVRPGKSIE